MKLCMFHPLEHPMKRGWVGRIDGDHVIHLAAQTIQSYFTGGGSAREHAVYPLDGVRVLAPVPYPPSIRVFGSETSFEFANPAAILGPGTDVGESRAGDSHVRSGLTLLPRIAVVIGAEEAAAGLTIFAEWRHPGLRPPKDRDFALGLGPVVVSTDELDPTDLEAIVWVDGEERLRARSGAFDWTKARDNAAGGTVLRPGDLLAGPALGPVDAIVPGSSVRLAVEGIGELGHTVLRD